MEQIIKKSVLKGLILLLTSSFFLISCIGTRQTIQIPDYILVPNGIEILGNKSLTAFVFENNIKNLLIEQYLSNKFKSNNFLEKEFWITIEKEKYKLIVYDNAEFEKYFDSANYSVINLEPDNAKLGDQRKFIAFSVININNQDCLAEDSLFQNIVLKYLKTLKDEYYNLK